MATILIVEDETAIQHLLNRIVSMLGHTAIVAGNGGEAVALAEQRSPDLIITDLSLPGKPNGIELVRALRKLNPDRPLVVTTGYTIGDQMDIVQAEGVRHILGKPFDILAARTLIASLVGNARA